ncbi:MAG: hypothetical protein KDD82_03805 [Planctomycetes bacterium]|nr:hypothetical protein [Planctomycetota bacterium]
MDPRERRRHHYLYAHRVLPPLAFGDPAGFCARLSNPSAGQASLEALWEKVGSEAPVALPVEGLKLSQHLLKNGRAVFLIQLPTPELMPEAHFVAVAPGPEDLAIYTLERSQDFETGEACTVVGAWNPEGDHLNLGRGPQPTREAFLARLGELLDGAPAAS